MQVIEKVVLQLENEITSVNSLKINYFNHKVCGISITYKTRERVLLIGKIKEKLHITFHNPNTGDDLIKELVQVMALVAKTTVEKELLELSKEEDVENDNKVAEININPECVI